MGKRAAVQPKQQDYERGVAAGVAWTKRADRAARNKLGLLLQRAEKRGVKYLIQTIPTVHKLLASVHPDDCHNPQFCAGFSIGVLREFTRQVTDN
jgi:hypothetical protein